MIEKPSPAITACFRASFDFNSIFLYVELKEDLDNNEALKLKLVNSSYLRDYAYTNQFEFLAVIIESFIDTP